jgi:hypothetical protein
MSTGKLAMGGAGIIALAAVIGLPVIGTAVYEFNLAHRAGDALALANAESARQQARLQDLQHQVQAGDQARVALQKSVDDARAEAAAGGRGTVGKVASSGGPDARKAAAADPKIEGQKFLAAFPDARALLIDVGKMQIARNNWAFYREAGLTPAQIGKFETLMADTWLQNIAVSPDGVHPDIRQLPDDQFREVLGDQDYQQFKDDRRNGPADSLALQVATAAINSNAPSLSADQADQVAQILMKNNTGFQAGGGLNPNGEDWDTVLAQTQGILSPAQAKAAEGVFLNMQYRIALNQAMRAQAQPGQANRK